MQDTRRRERCFGRVAIRSGILTLLTTLVRILNLDFELDQPHNALIYTDQAIVLDGADTPPRRELGCNEIIDSSGAALRREYAGPRPQVQKRGAVGAMRAYRRLSSSASILIFDAIRYVSTTILLKSAPVARFRTRS